VIVSSEKKFIFVAVPKTGSSSIERMLIKYNDDELNVRVSDGVIKHKKLSKIPEMLDRPYYKFCFFRNPWDRAVSFYHYHVRQGNTFFGHDFSEVTFEDWVKKQNLVGATDDRQTDYITYKGKLVPNVNIYKFEEIDDSWLHIQKALGVNAELPHLNKSKHKHYSEYYTDETRHIIKIQEYGVIKMMNYKFEEK